MTEKLNVYQKINKVRETNDYIQKKKMVDGRYMVVTHDQVTEAVRKDLVAQGVVIEPYMVSGATVQDTLLITKAKQPIIRFESVWDIFFVNVDTPTDRACIRVPAHALDTGDKAPGKACSYAVKMAMLKMFSIETGEDEEKREEVLNATGLTVAAYDEWCAKIDKLTGKDVKEITDTAQVLWELIHEEVNVKAKDLPSGTKLRGRLTNKVSALKKALKK